MLLQEKRKFHLLKYLLPFGGGFFLLLLPLIGKSQQNTVMTQYMFNNMEFNPAYAGSSDGINLNGWIRQQWIGFKDGDGDQIGPQTYLVTADAPITILHGGAALSIYQDKLGYFSNIGIKVCYAYRANVGPGVLSGGIGADIINTKIDFAKFKPAQESGDFVLDDKSQRSGLVADMTLGAYYRIPDKFYVGLSADQILQSEEKKIFYKLKRQYYLTGGYNWVIPGHPLFELQPSAMFLYDGAAFSFDVDALLLYNNKFWGGLGYRYQDAVMILAGINIKSIRVGISYDISTSSLSKYNDGSVEVTLGYLFKLKIEKFRKSYRNTRFL